MAPLTLLWQLCLEQVVEMSTGQEIGPGGLIVVLVQTGQGGSQWCAAGVEKWWESVYLCTGMMIALVARSRVEMRKGERSGSRHHFSHAIGRNEGALTDT